MVMFPYTITHPYQDNYRRNTNPADKPIDVWAEAHHDFNVSGKPAPT